MYDKTLNFGFNQDLNQLKDTVNKFAQNEIAKLAKEVDANIQGMYFRAKKEKRPFADVVKQYFDDQNLPKDDYENILNLMRKRLPALGIKQRL